MKQPLYNANLKHDVLFFYKIFRFDVGVFRNDRSKEGLRENERGVHTKIVKSLYMTISVKYNADGEV